MAVAFEHGAPHRLAGAGAGDSAGGVDGDHGKALEPGLRIGEGDEAGLAERVAAVTGHDVQQVVHLAVALAEQGHVIGRPAADVIRDASTRPSADRFSLAMKS